MNTNDNSASRKTWFITGASRGMGVDFSTAALAAGHNVVATGRNPEPVREAIGSTRTLQSSSTSPAAKHARALVQLADSDEPPLRWVAGDDAIEAAEQKAHTLLAQVDAHRELSSSLARDDVPATA